MAKQVQELEIDPAFKEITVGISRTFNRGSYESCRVECSLSASIEKGQTPDFLAVKMLAHLRQVLKRAYDDQIDGRGKGKDL